MPNNQDTASKAPMRFSIFTVQDHHPELPRSITDFYEEMLQQAELADRLGYDSFFVAEHHFNEYGVFPNPAVALAAIAQRTKRLRLGVAVSVLPFRNPLQVAEDYAMVDQLSHGRVALGVGSGYLPHEFEGFRVEGKEKRERFDEAIEILRLAMAGGPVNFAGKFHNVEGTAINVPCIQKPHPPFYVAVLRREAAYFVGKQGNRLMNIPYASVDVFDEIGPLVEDYRRGFAESGADIAGRDELIALHGYVTDSDEAAKTEAAEAFDLYVRTRLYAKQQVYDDIIKSGLSLFGSVETVADKLVALYDMGVRHVLVLQNFGALDHKLICRSMEKFAHEAMPRAAEIIARRAAA